MDNSNRDTSIRLRLLNLQRQPLGGTVDLEFKPQDSGETKLVKSVDASKDIDVSGLQRTPRGLYQLTVTPTDVFKPVSQFVSIPASGFNVVEVIVDKGTQTSPPPPVPVDYVVFGVVRDGSQRPLAGATVKAFDLDIRSEQPLGKPAITDGSGAYQIPYSRADFADTDITAADVIVRVFGADGKALGASPTFFNAPKQLRVDVDLSGLVYAGPSEFEQAVGTITPYTGNLPLSELTENDATQDITFLTNKTGLPRSTVEAVAMAFRFEKNAGVEAAACYALVSRGPADTLSQPTAASSTTNFDSKAALVFEGLMRADIDSLSAAIQGAITANIVPFSLSGRLGAIRQELIAAQQAFLQSHPDPKSPPTLTLKLGIAGLQGNQVASFHSLFSDSGATPQDFWKSLEGNKDFTAQKVGLLQSVFTLSQLTGEQLVLTDQLIQAGNVKSPDDLPKLAANTSQDWGTILKDHAIEPPAGIAGNTPDERLTNYAAELESNFVRAFPHAAFAARIKSDGESRIPNAKAISSFLDANPKFDLLATRIGAFTQVEQAAAARAGNGAPVNVATTTGVTFTNQLKRTQRVFKLAPTYQASNALLGDNVDSAHKVYRMGQANFVAKYGPQIGAAEAERTYAKATQAHSQALAIAGNLKSMSDASHLSVFPDYTTIISAAMSTEVPDLDSLFGHADFCECEECRSVIGAAAYLTDQLHYLDNRVTSIACGPGENASVAKALLRRRPDIADIDLNCDNTNTELPYIDIANEIMEDFIAPPAVTVNAALLPKFSAGTIDAGLLTAITSAFQAAGQDNVAALLTADASVSDKYQFHRLRLDNTCVTEDHWTIRDRLVVLKATDQGAGGIEVRLLHQTLLSSDEVSANPEYVNIPTYNTLKADVRPFTLPFDLFETEGEIYLAKLGTAKADLIDAFRPEHQAPLASGATPADLEMAFGYWSVSQGERNLIFQADTANQNLYWGALSGSPNAQLDLFQNAAGLSYSDTLDLLSLQFINPAADSLIQNDDLSCDTNKKHITNLTAAKFDAIHRFLRLWRKTSMTLEELDAVVRAPAAGNGDIAPALAWRLQHFTEIQKRWSLTVFQCLAFFQNLDTTGTDNLYNSLFQNRAVTNPLNPDFAIPVVTGGAPPAVTGVHKSILIGALALAPADLDALIAKTDGKLSLQNISLFFRMAQLAQALGISTGDLSIVLDLIPIDPFSGPVGMDAFYAKWRTVVSSQFAVGDLDYVLRHQSGAGSLVPSHDLVTAALADLQGKLLATQAATAVATDPTGQLLKKWLTDPVLLWDASLASKLLDILGTSDIDEYQQKVDNNQNFLLNLRVQYHDRVLTADLGTLPGGVVFPDSLAAQISYDSVNRKLQLVGYMSATDQGNLNLLSGDGPYLTAVGQLFTAAQQTSNAAANVLLGGSVAALRALPDAPSRYQLILTAISPVYRNALQQNLVQAEICGWFKINKDVASAIETAQPGIYTDLTSPAFVGKAQPLTAVNYPNQFAWYQKIAKVCFVTAKLKLSASDLTWLFANAAAVGALDLWSLPIVAVAGPVTTFAGFEVLVNILKVEQRYPAVTISSAGVTKTISVYTILEDGINLAAPAVVEADLAALTGWDTTQLDQLINAPSNFLNLVLAAAPSDIKDIRILGRLDRCFSIMKSFGATAANCVAWTKPALLFADAVQIKQALKARYPEDQWLDVTRPLQNKLRHARRDALVAHLLANPAAGETWVTSDDLYDYFLTDTQMTSCQPTSRIVQATNSVQQFVQRCFLHLEKNITVDADADPDWSQWQWMKYFRVWQANRKVFLYPENWIEPELLPTEIKSPFFQELENDLLQNDVTRDNVESAFLSYLEKLDGVSRLEVKAMWYDDPKKTLHVVARTYGGDPKTYFYRKFVENRRWTPWVKIDQDIASDHVVLTVFNHRVYLFWAVFSQKSDDVDTVKVPASPGGSESTFTPDKPPKYWQIQLAFTEYKNGKWTPKKVSNDDAGGSIYIRVPQNTALPDKQDFLFTPLDLPNLDFSKYLSASGAPKSPGTILADILKDIDTALTSNGDLQIYCFQQTARNSYAYRGTFDLDPCKGYPIVLSNPARLVTPIFDRSQFANMLDAEQNDRSSDALAVNTIPFLVKTPGFFANLLPLQMGFIDRLINIIYRFIYGFYYKGAVFTNAFVERIPVTTGTFLPYFYQDQARTYFVQPEISDGGDFEFSYQDMEDFFLAVLEGNTEKLHEILATFPRDKALFVLTRFFNFYHPLVCSFMRILFDRGIDALMSRPTQLQGDVIFDSSPNKFDFNAVFQPTPLVYSGLPATYTADGITVTDPHPGYPKADVDFSPKGGYSLYNWELFFHAPLMIGERLTQNLQFEDADHWFRYIFDPTDSSSYSAPDKYWITKPFFINVDDKYTKQNINNIMPGINSGDSGLVQDVTDWRNNPFQPHYIAQYRTVAYQKTAVMKYLDHLIAWGDNLFQQDTMETVAAAEQLYVLANQILGPKPQIIPPAFETPVDNFAQLEQKLDAFSNALVDIENLLPLQQVSGFTSGGGTQGLPRLDTLYFCIPPNDKLMGYWDTIANRLFNIRHCLNLKGQFAPLALFAPPIDPGLLVRAATAGLDIGSILTDLNSPLPNYRFSMMMQKATELSNDVKALGGSLLSAMEKKDAEDMALLRSKNGIKLMNAVLEVKKQQVTDATHALEGLQQQQALVQKKIEYYQGLISAGLNSWESTSLGLSQAAIGGETAAVAIEYLGDALALVPDFDLGASGFGGSPLAAVKFGGTQLGGATRAMAAAIRGTAGVMHSQASVASTQATYQRRQQEWQFQVDSANIELQQIQKQILGATVRQAIANLEVTNQQLQITNAQAEDDFMHSKFTNTELYSYMVSQLSTTYFQSYQLAYALAKQTEQTFRYELALADSSFIQFGYWNSLKKGLLAGEQLMYDLRAMDKAYHDQNAREYELTKHISLAQLDGSALQLLKTTGECWITLPEELFDIDYPGHYMRRVKTLSMTLPCVVGPYTTVACTLTMTRNSMRVSNTATGPATYPRKLTSGVPADDPRFRDAVGSIQSIATSSAQNDDGLFELNFRDERYLPFEGAGAISQWHLQLVGAVAQFDRAAISEVILHLKYTAREGGGALRDDATTSLGTRINSMLVSLKDKGLMRLFSARHEFPTEWYSFLNPPSAAADQVLTLTLTRDRFPYFASVATNLKIKSIELVADSSLASINGLQVAPSPTNAPPLNLTADGYYGPMLRLILNFASKTPGTWTITNPVANPRLTSGQLADMIVIVHYEVS
jgi:hypothetical protein